MTNETKVQETEKPTGGWSLMVDKKVQLFLTLAGVAVALLNIWLASNIAPLVKDLAVLNSEIEAAQSDISSFRQESVTRSEWATRNSLIDINLGRIEGKIDTLLFSLGQD